MHDRGLGMGRLGGSRRAPIEGGRLRDTKCSLFQFEGRRAGGEVRGTALLLCQVGEQNQVAGVAPRVAVRDVWEDMEDRVLVTRIAHQDFDPRLEAAVPDRRRTDRAGSCDGRSALWCRRSVPVPLTVSPDGRLCSPRPTRPAHAPTRGTSCGLRRRPGPTALHVRIMRRQHRFRPPRAVARVRRNPLRGKPGRAREAFAAGRILLVGLKAHPYSAEFP